MQVVNEDLQEKDLLRKIKPKTLEEINETYVKDRNINKNKLEEKEKDI